MIWDVPSWLIGQSNAAPSKCSVGAGLVLVVLVRLVGISARNVLQDLVLGGLSGRVLHMYRNEVSHCAALTLVRITPIWQRL